MSVAKAAYIGVDGVARKVEKMYIGVDGTARKVKKAYIGDENGVARQVFSSGVVSEMPSFTGNHVITGDENKGMITCLDSGTLTLGDGEYDVFCVGGGSGGAGRYTPSYSGGGGGAGGRTVTKYKLAIKAGDYAVCVGVGGLGGEYRTSTSITSHRVYGKKGGASSILLDQKLTGTLPGVPESVIVFKDGVRDLLGYCSPIAEGEVSYLTDGGVSLNGGYINLQKTFRFGSNFTISGWFRRTEEYEYDEDYSSIQRDLINQAYTGEDSDGDTIYSGVRLRIAVSGTAASKRLLCLNVGPTSLSGTEATVSDVDSLFPLNEWVHVAIVRTSGYVKCYINGVEKISMSYGDNYRIYPSGLFFIGSDQANSKLFKGDVDEIVISTTNAFWTEAFTPPRLSYNDNEYESQTVIMAEGGGETNYSSDGGSGGGTMGYVDEDSSYAGGNGGEDGSDGTLGSTSVSLAKIGLGQHTTTRAFAEEDGALYSGGGGAVGKTYGVGGDGGGGKAGSNTTGTAGQENSGGGGGACNSSNGGYVGGSGVVILRWGYESPEEQIINVLGMAENYADGTVYNGTGWKAGVKINTTSASNDTTAAGYYSTGYIAALAGDTLRFKNMKLTPSHTMLYAYLLSSDKKAYKAQLATASYDLLDWQDFNVEIDAEGNIVQLTLPTNAKEYDYIRISCAEITENSVITINQKIPD